MPTAAEKPAACPTHLTVPFRKANVKETGMKRE